MSSGLELPAPTVDWGTDVAFSMREVIASVVAGQLPPIDGGVTVVAEYDRPGVFSFSQHHVVAADVDPDWIRAELAIGDLSRPLSGSFLSALGERLGGKITDGIDMMWCSQRLREPDPDMPALVEVGLDYHQRISRSALHRDDVRAWAATGGCMAVGRGVGGRWEVSVEVHPEHRQQGWGRRLIQAARYVVPGEHLWAQIAVGNARLTLHGSVYGWTPVGAEALLF